MCKSIEDRIIGGMFGLAVGEAEAIAPDGADQKSWSRSTGLCLCTADGFLCEKNYGGVMQNFADFTENLKFVPPEKNFYIGDDVAALPGLVGTGQGIELVDAVAVLLLGQLHPGKLPDDVLGAGLKIRVLRVAASENFTPRSMLRVWAVQALVTVPLG